MSRLKNIAFLTLPAWGTIVVVGFSSLLPKEGAELGTLPLILGAVIIAIGAFGLT